MEHPVFGRIEWEAGTGQWRGRVQLDYFSEYEHCHRRHLG